MSDDKSKEVEEALEDVQISAPKTIQKACCLWADKDQDPDILFMSFPIKMLAKSSQGTMVAHGTMDENKEILLMAIKKTRAVMAKRETKIITPGSGPVKVGIH